MNGNIFEVIVVGAGPAGLMCSYYLKHLGLEHMLFDRGRLGESWRTQRWDNFRMITPFKASHLPGAKLKTRKPEAYGTAADMAVMLQEYVSAFQLPITEQAQVLSIGKASDSPVFQVSVLHDNEIVRTYDAWQVVVAAGCSNRPFVPSLSESLSDKFGKIHSSAYRDEQQLKPGGVLVVGGGQSGLEIAQDLVSQGRKVWLSSRPHPQLPREYRGREIFQWLTETKLLEDRSLMLNDQRSPVITYELDDVSTLTRSSLAERGVNMLGELVQVRGQVVTFAPWCQADVDAVNESSSSILSVIDAFITNQKLDAVESSPRHDVGASPEAASFDLEKEGITNIIWATGYSSSFKDIQYPMPFQENLHLENGLTSVDGLYIVGSNLMANSDYVVGAKIQASFVSNHIYGTLR